MKNTISIFLGVQDANANFLRKIGSCVADNESLGITSNQKHSALESV